jgi:hypothetical protein
MYKHIIRSKIMKKCLTFIVVIALLVSITGVVASAATPENNNTAASGKTVTVNVGSGYLSFQIVGYAIYWSSYNNGGVSCPFTGSIIVGTLSGTYVTSASVTAQTSGYFFLTATSGYNVTYSGYINGSYVSGGPLYW